MSETTKVPMDSFRDFLGNEVKVGDHVVYATTSGRSPVQKYAEVINIFSNQETRRHYFRGTAESEGHYGHKTFTTVKVGVRELSNGRNFTRYDTLVYDKDWRRVPDETKPARVTYPMVENIVLIRTAREIELAVMKAETEASPQKNVVVSDSPDAGAW